MAKKSVINRRDFISSAAIIGAGSVVGSVALLSSCAGGGNKLVPLRPLSELYIPSLADVAIDGKPLRAGVIGCGGRGTGAAINFLDAGPNLQIVALGDVFRDKIDYCRKTLKTKHNVDIPDNMCFTGFDNYKKVIASGVDVVILATPPAFRPAHFEAAVEAGKHVFMEKPGCVDPTGYRSIIASAKKAEAQGLSVVAGTIRRYQRSLVESFKQIQNGMIGEIVSGNIYWNGGMYWYRNRKKDWNDMEYMLRDWANWCWLSGDIMGELQVHNIDMINWFLGTHPVSAIGSGARHRKLTGDTYDLFNVDFEYEGGAHISSMCRTITGCSSRVSMFLQGTKGSLMSLTGSSKETISDLKGKVIWKWDGEKEKQEFRQSGIWGCYVLEQVDLINHIRTNTPVNQAQGLADSSLAGVMGRVSAYTGNTVTWDEISNSSMNLLPEKLEFGPMEMSKYIVPVPGQTVERVAK